MPISTRVSRLLAAIAALIAGVVPHAVAQETKGAPIVQREVFAEHPTINVVNTIMRVKRDGLAGVLIVGSGNASMSCFVPDGGTASCARSEERRVGKECRSRWVGGAYSRNVRWQPDGAL